MTPEKKIHLINGSVSFEDFLSDTTKSIYTAKCTGERMSKGMAATNNVTEVTCKLCLKALEQVTSVTEQND